MAKIEQEVAFSERAEEYLRVRTTIEAAVPEKCRNCERAGGMVTELAVDVVACLNDVDPDHTKRPKYYAEDAMEDVSMILRASCSIGYTDEIEGDLNDRCGFRKTLAVQSVVGYNGANGQTNNKVKNIETFEWVGGT